MAFRFLYTFLVICISAGPTLYSQNPKIDSLEIAYSKASSDSSRIQILKNISWEYLNINAHADLAKKYIDSVYHLSQRSDFRWGISLANYQYAVLDRQNGNYNQALTHIDKYLTYTAEIKDTFALANGLYQKAIILDDLGSFDKSLEIYYSILKIYQERNDNYSIAFTLNAIGEIQKKTGKIEEAMESYSTALEIFSQLDAKADMANAYYNIGGAHMLKKEYDQALQHYNLALSLDQETNSRWGAAYDYEAIGEVLALQGKYEEALKVHLEALTIREELQQQRELAESHIHVGKDYLSLNRYQLARNHLEKGMNLAETIGSKSAIQEAHDALSILYSEMGDFEKALEHKEKYITIKDSLFNETKSRQIEELQVRFDTEKQQAAITALEKDAEIADLKLKRQTSLRNITIAIAVLTILLSIVLFNRYKLRQRVRAEAEEKKRLIENERRKTELEKKRVEELEKIDKLKDEFLANTSHELRTPLNGIIGLTESLKDGAAGKLPSKAVDNLDMISNSGRRLSHLINDILDFSKLKNKDLILSITAVDLYAVVQVILRLSEPLVADKKIELKNNIEKSFPLVDADENRLQQILHNLVGNAIKFTHEGVVSVSAELNDQVAAITVTDTGIGIKKEKFDSIFDSFEQGDGSTIREYGGTGLGLSVTKQLVELHGGSISLKSEVDKGSSFTFTLPISKTKRTEKAETYVDEDEKLQSVEENHSNASGDHMVEVVGDQSKAHLLIVDDEPVNRRVLENHLKLAGYQITEASSGSEALEFMRGNEKFDLVLLDIMMPGMSGFEVCEKIREKFLSSELPIVMLTAKNRVSDLVNGFNAGANDYLTKPFSKNELLSRIKTHLNLKGIHKAASKFVPTEFIKSIGRQEITDVELGDQVEKEVTVLFSDIRDYTKLAEDMTPRQNFKFVNSFVGKMGPIISDYHGFVNQYLGDGIMALFPESATDALSAAIHMQKAVAEYNKRRIKEGNQPIVVGIGLHTGPLIMGIIGDLNRNDTAIISDTVNTASRMEGVSKYYGAKIIVSEASLDSMNEQNEFGLRYLGKVKVKGKEKAQGIYECFDGDDDTSSIKLKEKTLKTFDQAIQHFNKGEFPKASAEFDKVLSQNPNDMVARYFITKSAEFTLSGIPDDWDMATSLDVK